MKWRQMKEADVPYVKAMADAIHKAFPEDEAIFAERQRLYPAGCHVLVLGDALAGYAIAHPWLFGRPPALNSLLGALPQQPDTLYIHDVALTELARGRHAAPPHIDALAKLAIAAGLSNMSLTAVNGSAGFWQKNGFSLLTKSEKTPGLASYGEEACSMVRSLTLS